MFVCYHFLLSRMFAFTSSLVNVYLSHVITFYDSYAINVFSEMLITSTWKSFFRVYAICDLYFQFSNLDQ